MLLFFWQNHYAYHVYVYHLHKIVSHHIHNCYFALIADYGVDNYDIGTGFGHFGIIAEDVSSSKR